MSGEIEIDPQIKNALERIDKAAQEFEATARANEEYLISQILYLMHKHRYRQIAIPRQELERIKDAQDLRIDVVNDEIVLTVITKPVRFDDFKLTLPEHTKAIDPHVV